MTEIPTLDFTNFSKVQKYEYFHAQWPHLWDHTLPNYANCCNVYALLRQVFGWWWIGNYWVQGNCLKLGAFQGDPACSSIAFGKGVCGLCWQESRSIVVPNVHLFPGHIACSSLTNSEIVIPIYDLSNTIIGVLDVDSMDLDNFDDTDRIQLEFFCIKLATLLS